MPIIVKEKDYQLEGMGGAGGERGSNDVILF